MKRQLRLAGILLAVGGCTTVSVHRVRPDYEQIDKTRTKRLAVITQPLPDGQPKAGELFSLVARRYVSQKRNFIVRQNTAQTEVFNAAPHCVNEVEGVLWLRPHLARAGDNMEGELDALLLRCSDLQEIWFASVSGSFALADDRLKEVTKQYAMELGSEVEPYVAPAFNVLRPLLDTLPNPDLTEDEIGEKIEQGE